jgi:hypothetical protein
MSRRRPDGVLLEWQLTPPMAGVLPFLIDWGSTPHPTESLPAGLGLVSFSAFHRDPVSVQKGLSILGQELDLGLGEPGLMAALRTPNGEVVLR